MLNGKLLELVYGLKPGELKKVDMEQGRRSTKARRIEEAKRKAKKIER